MPSKMYRCPSSSMCNYSLTVPSCIQNYRRTHTHSRSFIGWLYAVLWTLSCVCVLCLCPVFVLCWCPAHRWWGWTRSMIASIAKKTPFPSLRCAKYISYYVHTLVLYQELLYLSIIIIISLLVHTRYHITRLKCLQYNKCFQIRRKWRTARPGTNQRSPGCQINTAIRNMKTDRLRLRLRLDIGYGIYRMHSTLC